MDSKRALNTELLSELFGSNGISRVTDAGNVRDAFAQAISHKKDGELLFCVGSLYLIGEIKAVLSGRPECNI